MGTKTFLANKLRDVSLINYIFDRLHGNLLIKLESKLVFLCVINHSSGICFVYVLYLFSICSVHVLYMFCICSIYVLYMFSIYSVYVPYMFCMCSVYVQYMFNICSVFCVLIGYLKFLNLPTKTLECMHVTLLYSKNRHVCAINLAIFRMVRTRIQVQL